MPVSFGHLHKPLSSARRWPAILALATGLALLADNTLVDASDRNVGVKATSHTFCPVDAIKPGKTPFPVTIDWTEIATDREAINCLHQLSTIMGPKMTAKWAEGSGFEANFIRQFSTRKKDVLLSLGWNIKAHGPLYNSGAKGFIIRLFAHSQVFSIRWESFGKLVVGQSYTFE